MGGWHRKEPMIAFQNDTHSHRIHAFSRSVVWFFSLFMNSCPKRLLSYCTRALGSPWERLISGTRKQPDCKSRLSAKHSSSGYPSSCLTLLQPHWVPVCPVKAALSPSCGFHNKASSTVLSSTPSLQTPIEPFLWGLKDFSWLLVLSLHSFDHERWQLEAHIGLGT